MSELSSGFIQGIARSVVRKRHGIQLGLEPTREARLLMFSFPIEVRYKVIESPPHWLSSRAVASNLRRMNRRYALPPSPVGGSVVLRCRGEVEPNLDLPPIVGVVGLRSMVEPRSSVMVAQIGRRAAAPGAAK